MIQLSIIVPVYNAENEISLCLDSLVNQVNVSLEIIIVNDCSTDSTLKIITEYQKIHSNITIINLPNNSGSGVARNIGIRQAKGKYIGFIDSDDWVDLNFYSKLIETIETDNSDIAIAGICNEYNNSISSCKRYSYESHLTVDGKTGLRLLTKSHNLGILITPIMNNKIYKHSFIVEHNLCCSDNKSWQDDFFSFFAILHANSISFTPDIQYHYYQRFSSVTHEATNSSTKIDNCIDVLLKIAKELHSQGIYEEYEKEYYSLVERNITSLLSMLKRGYNYSANNDFIYLYDKITMNFNMHKIISYIDSDRIFGFFNL
jgi:glycosyltransferase involved in cell wall biosynthesis